jgi:hypothetical protein
MTGHVSDAVSGLAFPGVSVRVAELGETATDVDGQFRIEVEALNGRYRVTASSPGVVARETSVTFPGHPVLLPLIPAAFNLQAFDEMVRQFGGAAALKRWLVAPALVIEMSLLNRAASLDPGGSPKDTLIASDEQQTEAAVADLVDQLTRALGPLTGGAFTGFASIIRSTTAADGAINLDRPGAITVVRYAGTGARCAGYGGVGYYDDFEIAFGRVLLETCSDDSLVAHELGHALGYGHVSAAASVMNAIVTVNVTDFDRQATAIAYQRPPGNRAPDSDPDTFSVNQGLRSGTRRALTMVRAVP